MDDATETSSEAPAGLIVARVWVKRCGSPGMQDWTVPTLSRLSVAATAVGNGSAGDGGTGTEF